jgi:hypothetical protein
MQRSRRMIYAWRRIGDEDYIRVADFNRCSAYAITTCLPTSCTPSDILHWEALPVIHHFYQDPKPQKVSRALR